MRIMITLSLKAWKRDIVYLSGIRSAVIQRVSAGYCYSFVLWVSSTRSGHVAVKLR